MGRKKNIPRCEVCGEPATTNVLETDCLACDNVVCYNQVAHEIELAVELAKTEERDKKWEAGRYV